MHASKSLPPACSLTTLFWGGNAVAGKIAVGHVSPMLLTARALGIGAGHPAGVGWRHLVADWPAVRAHLLLLLALGTLGFTVFNIALYRRSCYTTAINVSIEQAGMPMLIFLANFLLFRTPRGHWLQIVGFVMSLDRRRARPPAMATRRACWRSTSISATR